jgi:hypothetical protein
VPRPKPPMPLKFRNIRMSDLEWLMFQELGGADWLRKFVKTKAKFPAQHYMFKLKEEDDKQSRQLPS